MSKIRISGVRLKLENKEHRLPYTLRLGTAEVVLIQALADKYTEGNISAWLRYTALNYTPKANELESLNE